MITTSLLLHHTAKGIKSYMKLQFCLSKDKIGKSVQVNKTAAKNLNTLKVAIYIEEPQAC